MSLGKISPFRLTPETIRLWLYWEIWSLALFNRWKRVSSFFLPACHVYVSRSCHGTMFFLSIYHPNFKRDNFNEFKIAKWAMLKSMQSSQEMYKLYRISACAVATVPSIRVKVRILQVRYWIHALLLFITPSCQIQATGKSPLNSLTPTQTILL